MTYRTNALAPAKLAPPAPWWRIAWAWWRGVFGRMAVREWRADVRRMERRRAKLEHGKLERTMRAAGVSADQAAKRLSEAIPIRVPDGETRRVKM